MLHTVPIQAVFKQKLTRSLSSSPNVQDMNSDGSAIAASIISQEAMLVLTGL